jgi:hypothetical protein
MRLLNPILAAMALAAAGLAGAAPASAANYEFLAAPQINLSLVYRLDKLTGEIIACQYGHNPGKNDIEPGAFGVTVCYRSGEGAAKQEPGETGREQSLYLGRADGFSQRDRSGRAVLNRHGRPGWPALQSG